MLPMAAELYEDLHVPTDPEEQRRIHAEVLRRWLGLVPEAASSRASNRCSISSSGG
jgi:hypothetical protein